MKCYRLSKLCVNTRLLISVLLCNAIIVIELASANSQSNEVCPSMCICDKYKELNRAKCSHQRIISANVGMSSFVELLDLSYNDITTLDNKCFSTLSRLVNVSLDYNSIDTIDLDAFSALKELRHLSMAHNRLESFDNRILEQNTKLIVLNLAGNKFMGLQNVAIIKSQSLEILDLRDSKLSHLHSLFFKDLPNLRSVDLSKNLMITINVGAFEGNRKLGLVKIEGNPLNCDIQMEMTLLLLKRRNIKARLKNCPVPKVRQMFERMQMLPSLDNQSSPPSDHGSKTLNLTTVWRTHNYSVPILNQVCPLNDTDKACDLFETCVLNFSMLLKEVEQKLSHKRPMNYEAEQSRSWLHSISVNGAFYVGLFVGSIFGGSFIFIIVSICSKGCRSRKTVDRESRRRDRSILERSRPSRDYNVPNFRNNIPLIPQSPSTITTPTRGREVVQYHTRGREREQNSFFSLLFERPARRRYYRQLNQNATNLVRRLSQSRLFLNSSRSQNANYRNSYVNTRSTSQNDENSIENRNSSHSNTPASPLSENQLPIGSNNNSISLPSLDFENNTVVRPSDNIVSASEESDGYTSEPELFVRAETPPPAYKDILPSIND